MERREVGRFRGRNRGRGRVRKSEMEGERVEKRRWREGERGEEK